MPNYGSPNYGSPNYGDLHNEIYLAGLSGVVPSLPMSFAELERRAELAMPPGTWSYVAGGAGDEHTQRSNRTAFDHWGLVPRMLRARTERDLSLDLFGMALPTPVFLSPIGVVGICTVSTHGGRQANGGLAAIDCLPEVAAAVPDVPVLFDSGVRSGSDVVKALALGATAVGIGRPYAYAAALAGTDGIVHVLRTILAEADLLMAVDGYPTLADLGPDAVRRT